MKPTVFLSKEDDAIKLQDANKCMEKSHILALRTYGFRPAPSADTYVCISPGRDLLMPVSDYLKRMGYELESDASTSRELKAISDTARDYGIARANGLKVKRQKRFGVITPPNFDSRVAIKPYQAKSVRHMIETIHAANFSVPGSGKTLMSYAVYDILKKRGVVDLLFVVGPLSSFGPWEQEYQFCMKKDPKKHVLRYHGTDRHKQLRDITTYDVVLTSYPTASNDRSLLVKNMMRKKRAMMVIDESHHIKSMYEDATHATSMINLGMHAKRRYILSGTPMPHSFEDLWSQVTFLWPSIKILQTRDAYKSMLENYGADAKISEMIDFLWTRVTNKHLKKDMPSILPEQTINVRMSHCQEAIYAGIEKDEWKTEHDEINLSALYRLRRNRILRLLQSVTNPGVLKRRDYTYDLDRFLSGNEDLDSRITRYNEVPPKLTAAARLALQITKGGGNVVIWTVFVWNVQALCDEITRLAPHSDPLGISGDVPTTSTQNEIAGREEIISRFKESVGRVLVATVGSVAESISLHKTCHRAIYLERNFNAGQYMQSLSRIYRIGSDKKNPVKFIFLKSVFSDGTTETVDETIDKILKGRIRKMHHLLDDEFSLHPLSLDTSSSGDWDLVDGSGGNGADLIYGNVTDMITKHKTAGKI